MFFYFVFILNINIIDYKIKSSNLAFLFISIITSKIITANNISIFEDLNINKLDLIKDDF